jgi:hypothetical protein
MSYTSASPIHTANYLLATSPSRIRVIGGGYNLDAQAVNAIHHHGFDQCEGTVFSPNTPTAYNPKQPHHHEPANSTEGAETGASSGIQYLHSHSPPPVETQTRVEMASEAGGCGGPSFPLKHAHAHSKVVVVLGVDCYDRKDLQPDNHAVAESGPEIGYEGERRLVCFLANTLCIIIAL